MSDQYDGPEMARQIMMLQRQLAEASEPQNFVKRTAQQKRYGQALDLILIAFALFLFYCLASWGARVITKAIPVPAAEAAEAPRPMMTVTVRASREQLPGLYGCRRSS